jgi:hypothetical protein
LTKKGLKQLVTSEETNGASQEELKASAEDNTNPEAFEL